MKRWIWIIVLTGIAAAGIFYGLRQQPVPVEAAKVTVGPMQVTVEEEGKTRLRSRYIVSAPVTGVTQRLAWREGDRVRSGQTITVLRPVASAPLDVRSREQAEARVRVAQAALDVARARVLTVEEQRKAAESDLAYWQRQREREEPLVRSGDLPATRLDRTRAEIDRAEAAVSSAETSIATAKQEVMAAQAEIEAARATLTPSTTAPQPGSATITVTAPAAGRVIRRIRESEGVVNAGEALIEIGDSTAIEVEVEVLSADAVKIAPGTRVLFRGWGGEKPLEGLVRVVEPSGFTKISALGVEEQRVRVIADITSPEEEWRRLGDGFRVEASFVLWEGDRVLQVPSNALFRRGDKWAVFVIENGFARAKTVEVGHRTGLITEILSGVQEGDTLVAHPDETVEDGFPVQPE